MLVAYSVVKRLPMGDCAALASKDSNRLEQSVVNVPGAAAGNTVAPDVELKELPARGG
jgi:MATE family, multidrug efflux pump